MKQILNSRINNPENNVDWSSHIANIVSTATGMYLLLETNRKKIYITNQISDQDFVL